MVILGLGGPARGSAPATAQAVAAGVAAGPAIAGPTLALEHAKLFPLDAPGFIGFGDSVAIDGDTAIVGAGSDSSGPGAGAAYVFVRDGGTWTEQAKLTAADGTFYDSFGFSVAVSGDTTVVGSFADTSSASRAGAAYVFVREGTQWSQQARLSPEDLGPSDLLGWSVEVSGDTVVAGAPFGEVSDGVDGGVAYVFERQGTTWSQQAELSASGRASQDFFGRTVAMSGASVVIGALGHDGPGGDPSGAAYVFA